MTKNKFPKLSDWIYDEETHDLISKKCYKRIDPNTTLTTTRVYKVGSGGYIGYIYRGRHQEGKTNWWIENEDQDVLRFLIDVKLCDIGYKINNLKFSKGCKNV